MPPPQLTPWILPCAALGSLWFLAVLLLLLVDLRWLAYTTTALALAADAAVVTLVVKGRIPRPHPWTLTAVVLGNMWAVGAAVSAQNIYVSLLPANQALTWLAWVTLVVAFLASAVVGAFLATVLALASARCRKEGPASSETDDVVLAVADPLYNIDWLPVVDTTAPDDGDNGTSAGDRGGGGAIGMGQCPGRKRRTDQRDLLSDVECIKTHHTVDVIVSLTETREMDVMQCSGLAEACAAHGIAHVAFPWRDSKPSQTHLPKSPLAACLSVHTCSDGLAMTHWDCFGDLRVFRRVHPRRHGRRCVSGTGRGADV
jgi:hypothetical protein